MSRKRRGRRPAVKATAPTPVADYLAEQQAEGTRHSGGVFTIATSEAWSKLAEFQLGEPEGWILVLVQAAHRTGADKIKVNQSTWQTTVAISGCKLWGWTELLQVLEGQATDDPALYSFGVAVRALTGRQSRFSVITPAGTAVDWSAGSFLRRTGPLSALLRTGQAIFTVSHSKEEAPKWSLPALEACRAVMVEIYQDLVSRCMTSAIPIWCDGRRVAGIHLGPPPPPGHHRLPVGMLTVEDKEIPFADFSAAAEWSRSSFAGFKVSALSPSVSSNQVSAVGLLTATFHKVPQCADDISSGVVALCQGSSQYLWVLDGVVVEREVLQLPGSLGLTVIASARGLKTDISGLNLVQDRLFSQRRRALKMALRTELRRCWQSASEEGVTVAKRRIPTPLLFSFAVLCAGATFSTAALIPAVPAALLIIAYGCANADAAAKFDKQLDAELMRLPELL